MSDRGDTKRAAPPPRPDYGARGDAGPDHGRWEAPVDEVPARSRLADALEPGRLRDELARGAAPTPAAGPLPRHVARLEFTGEGAEYFRIWIVNTLLTLASLGVYSAWAKVRKTRYFWQNTRLDGHVFDFHGSARAILVGRILALALLVGYSFAFEFSRAAGLAMIALLFVVGPWLFMRAQRFKLANTSWRGLRFGFASDAGEAYRVALPPLAIWFSGAIAAALAGETPVLVFVTAILPPILVPWMHHRLKAYQHSRARYGASPFGFVPTARGFYAVYMMTGVLTFGAFAALMAFASFGLGALFAVVGVDEDHWARIGMALSFAGGFVVMLVVWPYFAARMQALVWSHTRVGDVRFATAIAAGPLARLVARNVLLTLVTAGLYWPYAAVALARYRVQCMRAESQQPLLALASATAAGASGAAGDAAVDAFGLDIGL